MILTFFNISGGEIFIILLVVFLFFGPDKIPEIARWVGKGMGEIKRATSEIRDEITRETDEIKKEANTLKKDLNVENPFKHNTPELSKKSDKVVDLPDRGKQKKEPHL